MDEMSNRLISIIIVSKGKNDYLWALLDSIMKQTYRELEIIVVDNSLNLKFSQEIVKRYPEIKLYSQEKNLFYCEALNLGIRQSKGDFILCLNDDVILDKRFIEEAIKGFFIKPDIGMISGKILRNDTKTLDSAGLSLSPWRTARERGYGTKDTGQFERQEYIFGVNGAVAFYRRKMLESIKLDSEYFDIDYRIFYEDLDIAWRAQRWGWKAYYIPYAIAYHIRGGTVRLPLWIDKPYARKYLEDGLHTDLIKNRYLTIIKNESIFNFLIHLPHLLFYDVMMWIYCLLFKPQLAKSFLFNLNCLNSAFKKRSLIR